jgi:DNA-directed RNA polymerase specialized sigma24 family protein
MAAVASSLEQRILRARARGGVSAERSFEEIHALYAPLVRAWLAFRLPAGEVEDLVQDVWLVFYGRWRGWEVRPEHAAPEAKPILSFLYRTCHFVLMGHRRRRAAFAPASLEGLDTPDPRELPGPRLERLELGRCLGRMRAVCPEAEQHVVLAKLAGVPAREIARALGVTEPVVDHRFRGAVARLKKDLAHGSRRAAGVRRRRHG